MVEQGWAGRGGLAMKQGEAAPRTCKQVGVVIGDQGWSQETWVLSLPGNLQAPWPSLTSTLASKQRELFKS